MNRRRVRIVLPLVAIGAVVMTALAPAAAPPAPPRDRPWIERVERDRDRGAGRVVDEPTWETGRLRDQRDVRLGRLRPRRELERLDEERDRRLQLDERARRGQRPLLEPDRAYGSVILSEPPGAPGVVMSPIASQAAADERMLGEAKDKLDRSLRGVNSAEQRALRTLRRRLTREGRAGEFEQQSAPLRQRHEQLRAGHRADYERTRSRILGRP